MSYTETFEGVNMDVQAIHINISDNLQQRIRKMIKRLRRDFSELNWVTVYFNKKNEHSRASRTVSVRLGISGSDAFASDSGDNWVSLLKCVEGKLRGQLKKRIFPR